MIWNKVTDKLPVLGQVVLIYDGGCYEVAKYLGKNYESKIGNNEILSCKIAHKTYYWQLQHCTCCNFMGSITHWSEFEQFPIIEELDNGGKAVICNPNQIVNLRTTDE